MALILNIDTAVQNSSVCLADGQKILDTVTSLSDKESAAWLHTAVQQIIQNSGHSLDKVDAIAISQGPGSYTGLRVGMATAKGLCYALSKPLIVINTLQMMAAAATASTQLLCPMIDARRMEVFTALYDEALNEVMPTTNMILDEHSFEKWLNDYTITFFGNGSLKAASVIHHSHASFAAVQHSAQHMVELSALKFEQGQFSDVAYTEPLYGKEFFSPISKKNY